jgi:hypothetical protein
MREAIATFICGKLYLLLDLQDSVGFVISELGGAAWDGCHSMDRSGIVGPRQAVSCQDCQHSVYPRRPGTF